MERRTDSLSFWDHLEDLRKKILLALLVFALAFLALYFFFSSRLVEHLVSLSRQKLCYLSVFEPFFTRMRVSAWAAAFVAMPFLIAQIARFVLPGLHRRERVLFVGTLALFGALVVGVGYVLFRFSPYILSLFLDSFASPEIEMKLSVSTFVTFYLMLFASDAAIVLIPLATFLLLKLGVLRLETVSRSRRYVVPILLFVAAVITPPDPASMIIVFIPLWGVFELSLVVFRLMMRGRARG